MVGFYIGALLFVLIASLFIFVPVIRFNKEQSVNEHSLDWYKVAENELEKDYVAGKLNKAAYDEAVIELKKRLTEDLSKAEGKGKSLVTSGSANAKLFAVAIMLVTGIAMYAALGAHSHMQRWETSVVDRSGLAERAFLKQDPTMSTTNMVDLALGIRTRLVNTPEDATGWMLLGRVLLVLRDQPGSEAAYAKAHALASENKEITIGYSQALLFGEDRDSWQKALNLTKDLLSVDPMNITAMIMFSAANIRLENTSVAKESLNILLQMLSPDDPRHSWAKNELATLTPEQTDASALLTIEIDISEKLLAQLEGYQYVFVFAKSDNMPMPVAAKKVAISEFPMTVTLTDNDAPMPTQKLSSFDTVNVVARLSMDGNIAISDKRLETAQNGVSVGEETTVHLVLTSE
ncbi:c-type cytochrome biogenesis protein CcmI [Aestuariibacter sp. AA17]|uniref:C-type cytochrome biogenesis protein CcmI n=1 Tax=Fluctibacter corallii TaxID=2984329 RepID=A0ABT3A4Y7_9ALTE|nr:c-type cytochrome biogenesis protein CcmI [Aestuariibacter sp. AA17]MCV2883740.1 c-type cytochrome biogenesis protein CcmI [Aestuariibacter sp. AA17]